MKHIIRLTLVIAVMAPPAIAAAAGSGAFHVAQATDRAAATAMAEGEVRKVDKDAGKITLRHGEIRSLDMPSMTMVFQVKDKALLDTVKPGDKVRFSAEKAGGTLVVTAIEPAR